MKLARAHLKNSAAFVVSLLFIAWFVYLLNQTTFDYYNTLLEFPSWLGCFVFFGLPITYLLRGWRVAYEFRDYPELTLLKSIQVVLWHNASVNFLPFRSGEVAFPILLHRIAQVPMVRAVASLMHLRMQDASTVLLLAIAFWPNLEGSTRLLMSLTLLGLLIGFYRWLKAPANWQNSSFVIKRYLSSLRLAMATGNPNPLQSWLLTLSNWLIKISVQAALYCVLAKIDLFAGVLATISSEVSAFSPLQGIAGIGTFEVSSALAMYADGVPWDKGIQIAAIVHLIMLCSAFFWTTMGWLLPKLTMNKTEEIK